VQRVERGNLYVDLPRAPAIIPREEQIPGERFRQGERVRAYLYSVEESNKGVFLKLSRSHPQFLAELFKIEAPEITSGTVEIKSIAREAGSRSKIAVVAEDEHIDPVGSLVGQRGVRVSTVMSELGGEKIDIIEWSEDPKKFIEEALSPAQIVNIDLDEESGSAAIEVTADQQSLAIGRSGQNVRLAAKLTGWKIDITSMEGEHVAEADTEGDVDISENADMDGAAAPAPQEAEQAGNGGDETAHNDQEGNASEEVAAESNARDASAEDETATNEEAEQSGADDESDTETDSVAAEHEEDTKATDAQADASEPDTDTKSTT
jgi:N utilization substance protein A